ncbi:MAG: ZIP family metal transporter [Bacteroidota bacterium]
MPPWLAAVGSVFLVSLVSLVGLFTLSWRAARLERFVFLLVALAVGAMLGGAVLHLIPQAYDQLGDGRLVGILVLVGVLAFFVLEKFLHWHHDHGMSSHAAACVADEAHAHEVPAPVKPFALMNLVGDAAHNLIDGMVIAAAYLVSIPVGIVTTLAVLLHELPQEIGDFGVLVYGGMSRRRALAFNFASGLVGVVGAVVALLIGTRVEAFGAYLLPITAGSFLYIAGSDLIPELHHHSHPAIKSVWQFVMIVLGIALMLLPMLAEDALGIGHAH